MNNINITTDVIANGQIGRYQVGSTLNARSLSYRVIDTTTGERVSKSFRSWNQCIAECGRMNAAEADATTDGDHGQDGAAMRTVTIMYRASHRSGWAAYPMAVEVAWVCPVCGGPRGEPRPYRFCEDGEWFTVDRWDNDCGHVDRYRDVYAESLNAQREAAAVEAMQKAPEGAAFFAHVRPHPAE